MHSLIKIIGLSTLLPIAAWAGSSGVDQAVVAAKLELEKAYGAPSEELRITVKRPDRRLVLKTCAHPPSARATNSLPKSGKLTIKVHCASPAEWSIYLPAKVLHRIKLWSSVHGIERGSIIAATDIEKNLLWLTRPPTGAVQRLEKIVGMEVRQSIQPGRIIKQRQLRKPLLIRKGHRLSAAVREPGFMLSTEVIALEDGADGDTIKVRNAKTEKLLWVTVTRRGQLIIN